MAKIYISSTYSDLKVYREAVYKVLRQMEHNAVAMEDYVATDERPAAKCLADVERADLYVGIFAWRYGYIPPDENPDRLAITEMEYRHAKDQGKVCLIFVLSDEAPWSPKLMDLATGEGDRGGRINELRQQLGQSHIVSFYSTADELATLVSVAVQKWQAEQALHATAPGALPVSAQPSSFWLSRPGSLDNYFVGRAEELGKLTDAFAQHRIVVISGGAGTGKSRLAAEYTHRFQLNGFWTTAGNDLTQTLIGLAPSLGVSTEGGDEDIAKGVVRRLNGLTQKNEGPAEYTATLLWVVDNLADLNLVNELTQNIGSVNLLVTSRSANQEYLPRTAAFIELKVLEPDAATELLSSRRRDSIWDQSDPTLMELAEAVGRLPLALEMLSVRLGARRQTPDRILTHLRNTDVPIKELGVFQETAGATIPRAEGVYATIVGALGELSPEVRDQISPLGYTADQPIPDPLLGALTGLGSVALDQLIEECSGRSIFADVDNQVVVHPLTVAGIEATNQEGAPTTALSRADLRLSGINEGSDIGALRLEISHYQRILECTRRVLGAESTSVLNFANSLANGYHALGRYEEAVALDEETRRIRERVLGPEHPDTLGSCNNLAIGYDCLGRYEDVVALDEETWQARERVLGPEHPDTLQSRHNLASGYYALGRNEEAVALFEETRRVMERVLGPENFLTLDSRHRLAIGYRALGRYEEAVALDLDEETRRVMERVLGPEHLDTHLIRDNLANRYRAVGGV